MSARQSLLAKDDGSARISRVPAAATPIPRRQMLVLATALFASLSLNVAGQTVSANIDDIQGDLGLSSDEGSWLVVTYAMGLLCGVVLSSPLLATLGMRRYVSASALLFALGALGCAMRPDLPALIALRTLQGVAAGGFGPVAFVAVFTITAGPRLPLGLAVLALVLLLPINLGPVISGWAGARLDSDALFLIQAAIGAVVAILAVIVMPRAPMNLPGLKRDWAALLLLSVALSATILVLGQGTRLYWLDNTTVRTALALAVAGWAGFFLSLCLSPLPALNLELLRRRHFIVPVSLNLLFRASLAFSSLLLPQFLAITQGYRGSEFGALFLPAIAGQLIAFPLAWWALRQIDGRWLVAVGLALVGLAVLTMSLVSGLGAADQFRGGLVIAGMGQVLFLVPNLVAGGRLLTPPDGPSASLLFNATTLGGTTIGSAVVGEYLRYGQVLHFDELSRAAGAFGTKAERIEALGNQLAPVLPDDSRVATNGLALLDMSFRQEAWVHSFNEAGASIAGILFLAAVAACLLVPPQPSLGPSLIKEGGSA